MAVRIVVLGVALAAGIVAAATPATTRAGECAGGVDATGNECNGGLAGVGAAASTPGDVLRYEANTFAARLDALRAEVKQRELKLVVAKTTLRGAEIDLDHARESLEAYERSQARGRGRW